MFKLLGRVPKTKFHVACSGGSDSMIVLDFLMRYPKNDFDILHFNHGTKYCDEAEKFVTEFAERNGIEVHVGRITSGRVQGESQEEYWRNQRYAFFKRFSAEPIVMAHHLNDAIETWVMTSLAGNPQLIPYHNPKYNVIRPFLAVPKSEIETWAKAHGVKYVTDGSNYDTSIKRNYVRHVMMTHVRAVNPGIEKTIMNKVRAAYAAQCGKD